MANSEWRKPLAGSVPVFGPVRFFYALRVFDGRQGHRPLHLLRGFVVADAGAAGVESGGCRMDEREKKRQMHDPLRALTSLDWAMEHYPVWREILPLARRIAAEAGARHVGTICCHHALLQMHADSPVLKASLGHVSPAAMSEAMFRKVRLMPPRPDVSYVASHLWRFIHSVAADADLLGDTRPTLDHVILRFASDPLTALVSVYDEMGVDRERAIAAAVEEASFNNKAAALTYYSGLPRLMNDTWEAIPKYTPEQLPELLKKLLSQRKPPEEGT